MNTNLESVMDSIRWVCHLKAGLPAFAYHVNVRTSKVHALQNPGNHGSGTTLSTSTSDYATTGEVCAMC